MIDLASYSATETLRDGRTVEIRALRPTDREGLLTAVMRCNAGTLYHRFFAVKREFSEKEVHFFFDIDFVKHVALVASVSENGRPTIIGSCRYIVVAPGRAEVAFLVVDDYQRKGLGKALMRRLAAIGRKAGLAELVADVLADNVPMLKVFEHSGLAKREARRSGPARDPALSARALVGALSRRSGLAGDAVPTICRKSLLSIIRPRSVHPDGAAAFEA